MSKAKPDAEPVAARVDVASDGKRVLVRMRARKGRDLRNSAQAVTDAMHRALMHPEEFDHDA